MKVTAFLFNLLAFLLPLTFFPQTSELFEFNKIVLVYVFTILISASWAFECISQNKLIFNKTILTIPILIFLVSQIVSTVISIDIRTSIFGYYGRWNGGLLSTISYSILYFAFTSLISKKQIRNFIKIMIISTAIATVYAAFEHFGKSPSCAFINTTLPNPFKVHNHDIALIEIGINLITYPFYLFEQVRSNFNTVCWVQDVQLRAFGTFGQPNWLAAFLAAVAPLTWAVMLSAPKHLSRMRADIHQRFLDFARNDIIYFPLPAVLFTTLLFTKSRSGLLAFVMADILFWAFILKINFKKYIKKLLILNIIFVVLFFAFVNPEPNVSQPDANISDKTIPSDYQGGTESGEIRRIVWRGAIDLWKKYPIFGTGVETFAFSYYETRPVEHNRTSEWNYLYNKAHNEYLNFAATTGTFGLSAYLFLIVFSIITFVKNGNNTLNVALWAGYVSILVTNFFGFSTVTVSVLFFLFPAISEKT